MFEDYAATWFLMKYYFNLLLRQANNRMSKQS